MESSRRTAVESTSRRQTRVAGSSSGSRARRTGPACLPEVGPLASFDLQEPRMSRILVAEDSTTQALAIKLMLEAAGHGVAIARNGREALLALSNTAADLVLTDLKMPEMDGLQLVEAVRVQHPLIPVILMSAHGSEEIAADALQRGAASYVPKRRMARDMVRTVDNVLAVSGEAVGP